MLVLTRKPNEKIIIGDNIVITVVEIKGDSIRLGIDAPREVKVYRGELYEAIAAENRQAALPVDLTGLDSLKASPVKKPL
jgi:carbon storage regulator